MRQPRYYVVWKGRERGIFGTWGDCQRQVHGYSGAQFRSFRTRGEAERAWGRPSGEVPPCGRDDRARRPSAIEVPRFARDDVQRDGIAVDGAWNTATGDIEYRGVDLGTGEVLFEQGPYGRGTSNIAEFLAIVHGLAYCKREGLGSAIYSDSRVARGWVRARGVRTGLERGPESEGVFVLVDRAMAWLRGNEYSNPVLKWETRVWGENPADFGRK